MTIDLNVSRQALMHAKMQDDESSQLEHTTAAWMGIDLSLLGAQTCGSLTEIDVEPFHYGKMAAATRAAAGGGLDFVALSAEFVADSAHRQLGMDTVSVGSQLCSIPGLGVVMEVEAHPRALAQGCEAVGVVSHSWASLAITIDGQTDFNDDLCRAMHDVRSAGVGLIVNIRAQSLTAELTASVAKFADMVRLRVPDPHVARGLRYGIRAAAHEVGRNLPVVVDIGIVISATAQAAHERALLIEAITGVPLFPDVPKIIGTVHEVADSIERWVGLGAADGVVVLPASLPTDLGSLIRGVLPLLSGRAGVEVKPQSLI
ncbi:hypothetical protein [Arcanobacterium pinnipediorum]|uniref:Uncharacterized protein n=1 Tax=Arcanobacterium pinnipediorum TaxID=1503041 RepID=A0ABY5AF51_9ACTO|nr:hypothetical protein [Arcanobacterium pinnipediorum]USR78828.1 hypothetical protein NG665_05390 [Arcanobacterium pinnipediorum]